MPKLPLQLLVDSAVNLPCVGRHSFWLNGSAWEVPDFTNAEVFIHRLVGKALLVRDEVVTAALQGDTVDLTSRSVQRCVLQATGWTRGAIRQMERAKMAVDLLDIGASIIDTVEQAGFADRAHLTRSLRRFMGQTPIQVRSRKR